MKFSSIKYKITFWYTLIISISFSLVIIGASIYSEKYGEAGIRAELLDEVNELKLNLIQYSNDLEKSKLLSYYDDGVTLSTYDSEFNLINGGVPEKFPEGEGFSNEKIKTVRNSGENWIVYEEKVQLNRNQVIWIRGIHSYSSIVLMMQRMTWLMCIIFPLLAVFTAYLGYQMIKRSLQPMNVIAEAANEIAYSQRLSRRIQLPKDKDEFFYLTTTVNNMLEGIEESFVRERQFSSDAAHELRTPLSVILSHCEYCLDELKSEEKIEEEIKIIRNKTRQMSELVSNLLMISRQEKEDFKPDYEEVELQFLAESVMEELEEKASIKGITIQISSKLNDATIQADMSMMTRMFINIVDNGINYGKAGGYIRINMEDKGEIVCIKFEDNGIGIANEEQKKIWDRFYQEDSSHSENSGFGLGLFMVKQIVVAHKGTIYVESEKGEGSTFIVELPKYRYE